ncbi:MAG: hypothetical protein RID53_06425 [Coleofasciculus sp. B1-GNL1-01]|uniref:hypothetical protein n=1 Tax=Coleofasciculus sp. B1-GNL1-01 TaxID=3068484 RepID=UPI0032FB21B5
MTLPELQKQALQLPIGDRWKLVQTLLESLQWETRSVVKKGNLSRLRGIAKSTNKLSDEDITTDYVNYLTTSPTKLTKVKYDGSR